MSSAPRFRPDRAVRQAPPVGGEGVASDLRRGNEQRVLHPPILGDPDKAGERLVTAFRPDQRSVVRYRELRLAALFPPDVGDDLLGYAGEPKRTVIEPGCVKRAAPHEDQEPRWDVTGGGPVQCGRGHAPAAGRRGGEAPAPAPLGGERGATSPPPPGAEIKPPPRLY